MLKRIGIVSIVILSSLFLLFNSVSYADYRRIKAIGEIEWKKGMFKKKPGAKEIRIALEKARKSALDKFIAGLDSQRVRILNNLKDELYQNIDTYVPEVLTLNDGKYENGYWKVFVEASINEAQIEELVNKYIQRNIQKKQEAYLSFIFVAREVERVRTFMDKKTERTIENESYKEYEGTTDKGESAGKSTAMHEKVSGGSVQKKSEKVRYRGYNPEEIEAKVTEIFTKAAFEVVPAFEVDVDPDKFATDFAERDKISNSTKKKAVATAREAGIDYLSVGMLDVGREQTDQATGLYKIYVRVTGYILDLKGKFAKKIASIGPVQYSGLGENPKVAKVNALLNASTAGAKDLVDQLRAKRGL